MVNMIWRTANRLYVYFHNKDTVRDIRQFINEYNKGLCTHIFLITDIPTNYFDYSLCDEELVNKFRETYPLYDKLIDIISTNVKPKTKVQIVGIRFGRISKQITRLFKHCIRAIYNDYQLPTHSFSVTTYKDFYFLLDNGVIYRITNIPNTQYSSYTVCKYIGDDQTLLRIAGTIEESIVDGIGMRYVVFVQGCPHHCNGCHNPETWDYTRGRFVTVVDLANDIIKNPMLSGVTFSGGEPFMQAYALNELRRTLQYYCRTHNRKFDFTVYSGYTLEELQSRKTKATTKSGKSYILEPDASIYTLLNNIDYLVDGEFQIDKKSMNCKFRGSSNQKMYKRNKETNTFEEIFPVIRKDD